MATAQAAAAAASDASVAAASQEDPGKGRDVFNGTCAHCHGPNAVVEDRKINLRRLQIKYAERMEETYFTTVLQGRPSKGMPAWKEVLRIVERTAIAAIHHAQLNVSERARK